MHGLSVEQELPAIRLVNPGQQLDQCRLTGAVFADEDMDFARTQIEADVVEGDDAGKPFGDAAELQDGGTGPDWTTCAASCSMG